MAAALPLDSLREAFGERLRQHEPVARYTSARIGGEADALIEATSAEELEQAAGRLWELEVPFVVMGGGSNMLVSDRGIREVVVLNHAREIRFDAEASHPRVWAESGANLGTIARQAAGKGLGGLEWAAGIPGTIGGAVVGNAGAHGGDIGSALDVADILHHEKGRETWTGQELAFAYRQSWLKRNPGQAVVLTTTLSLAERKESKIREQMDIFLAYRRLTQPPGASMGSMFKNPDGDYAGRLIDHVGLKGKRHGNAQISHLHGNFFLNLGDATADEVYALISEARETVARETGIELELEVQLVGDWSQAEE